LLLGGVLILGTLEPAAAAGGNAGSGLGNAKTVFLTSQVYDGDLGGLQGADQKCQALATAAGLKGTYRAWLSDSTASPSTRFSKSKGPYKLVDGTVVATNWADLTDGNLQHRINISELGTDPFIPGTSVPVWTNTRADGTVTNTQFTCDNFTSATQDPPGSGWGIVLFTNFSWTELDFSGSCSTTAHLYCFQQ
jgi:hypothetical protein